jgi:hypothetical protein
MHREDPVVGTIVDEQVEIRMRGWVHHDCGILPVRAGEASLF